MKSRNSWSELTQIAQSQSLVVERVRLEESGIALEGAFELPPLARLSLEEQVFVAAFVKSHGSIKEMERLFGVSYPTIKGKLNALGERMGTLGIDVSVEPETLPSRTEVLRRLERGEISADQAVELLRK